MQLFTWADATVTKLSGKLELAKAFRYTITRREALTRFVTDGRLEADNNTAENAMRVIALGRRNYLFAGSDNGGERAASIYTLVATAKLNGLNPQHYLADQAPIAHQLERLTPVIERQFGGAFAQIAPAAKQKRGDAQKDHGRRHGHPADDGRNG